MSAGRRATLGTVLVVLGLAAYSSLLGESSPIHLCPPDLCNGATVISPPQPAGKKVLAFKVSADGSQVIFVSNASCKRELYSVASTGGAVAQLSDLPNDVADKCFRNVTDEISISPDGRFAVWEADRDRDQDYELYSTPILGGPVVQLNPPLVADHDVERHLVSCDSATVVYRQGKDSSNRWELYAAPIRGAQQGRRISQAMGMSQAVGSFWLTCDATAWYMADTTQSGNYDLWRVPISGTPPPVMADLIFVDGFESGSVGAWR